MIKSLSETRKSIVEIVGFLKVHNDLVWTKYLSGMLSEFDRVFGGAEVDQQGGKSILEKIDKLFGGMGSLNDLNIYKENGHIVSNEREANVELSKLRSRLFDNVQRSILEMQQQQERSEHF